MLARLLSLLAVLLLYSPLARTQPLPLHPELVTGQLDNGLRYYILSNTQPRGQVAFRLAIKAGSLLEDEDQRGLAHFVEHMAFNGTQHFPKNELVDFLERSGMRFGADLNAYTSFEETVYQLQVNSDSTRQIEQALLILSDWARGLEFDSTEIEQERGVVLAEWRNRLSPDQRLQQQYYPLLYQGSRYAQRLPIGDTAIIQNASSTTIQRYYDDWYRPELAAIIVAGDIDPAMMQQQIIATFADWQNPDAPRERNNYQVPLMAGSRSIVATDPEAAFTQTRLTIRQAAQADSSVSDFAERLKIRLYNSMLGARLYELQQTAHPPFTFASSAISRDMGQTAVYHVSAFVSPENALAGFESVYRETIRARQYGFTSTELERAGEQLLASARQRAIEQEHLSSTRLANELVAHFLRKTPMLSPVQYLELVETILPQLELVEINALASKWIIPEQRSLVITAPEQVKPSLPSPATILTAMQAIEQSQLLPYIDQTAPQELFDQMLEPGIITQEIFHDSLEVTEWQLSNGMTIVLKPTDCKADEILLEIFSPGGHALADSSHYQSALAAATLASLSGVGVFSAPDLYKKLSGQQVRVTPYITEYEEGIKGQSSTADLETMLQLCHLYFTDSQFSNTALQGYRQRQTNILKHINDNPYYRYANLRSGIQYQNHPRRRPVASMEDLAQIDLVKARNFYQKRFSSARGFTCILTGNFDPAQIRPLLLLYLGSLPADERITGYRDLGIALAPGKVDSTLQLGQTPKALVDLTFHGSFVYQPEQRYYFSSLLALLRIQLREQLREALGAVYTVRVNGSNSRYPRQQYKITISYNCDPALVDTLLYHTALTIQQLQEQGPSASDLQKIKETQLQARQKAEQENSFWMAQLRYRYQNDFPLAGASTAAFRQRVSQLTARDLQEAARQYFDFEQRINLVLLPEQ